MLLTPTLLAICSLACTYLAAAHPLHPGVAPAGSALLRDRRSAMAARTMILVRGHQSDSDRGFNPRAAMAAYATGGTVAAGSFYGARAPSQKQRCGDCHEQPAPPRPEEDTKAVEPPPEEAPEEVQEKVIPERQPKVTKPPPKRLPVDEDEEDVDEEEMVSRRGSSGGSVYKNFFPMTFGGGGGRARSRLTAAEEGEGEDEGEDGDHRGIMAIANSFSKGRGAVASSSAVAHGASDGGQQTKSQQSRYRARA